MKLTENIFRAVNIALVNELKVVFDAMGIDVWEVIEAAADQALRLHAVLSRARASAGTASRSTRSTSPGRRASTASPARFIELAGEINTAMPCHVVDRLAEALDARLGKGLARRARSWCSASPTRRTSTTCARARRCGSSSCWRRAGARGRPTTTRCVPEMPADAASTPRWPGGARWR